MEATKTGKVQEHIESQKKKEDQIYQFSHKNKCKTQDLGVKMYSKGVPDCSNKWPLCFQKCQEALQGTPWK